MSPQARVPTQREPCTQSRRLSKAIGPPSEAPRSAACLHREASITARRSSTRSARVGTRSTGSESPVFAYRASGGMLGERWRLPATSGCSPSTLEFTARLRQGQLVPAGAGDDQLRRDVGCSGGAIGTPLRRRRLWPTAPGPGRSGDGADGASGQAARARRPLWIGRSLPPLQRLVAPKLPVPHVGGRRPGVRCWRDRRGAGFLRCRNAFRAG